MKEGTNNDAQRTSATAKATAVMGARNGNDGNGNDSGTVTAEKKEVNDL